MQLDCNALCECWDTCGDTQYCVCQACQGLHPDAASDTQFFTIKDAAASAGAAQADIIATTTAASSRRRLLQSSADNITAELQAVLQKVDVLRGAQDSISGQMTALQSQVDKANLLAEARAASTKLQDLITGEQRLGLRPLMHATSCVQNQRLLRCDGNTAGAAAAAAAGSAQTAFVINSTSANWSGACRTGVGMGSCKHGCQLSSLHIAGA